MHIQTHDPQGFTKASYIFIPKRTSPKHIVKLSKIKKKEKKNSKVAEKGDFIKYKRNSTTEPVEFLAKTLQVGREWNDIMV